MAEDRVHKCLNPVGTQMPVKTYGLAPRLESLDGKTVHMSICGEADIWVPLEKKLKADYPNVNWTIKKRYHIVPMELSEEERKTTDAVILGVCW
ncbi:hypothetical protein ACFLYN_06235 [Chloroflexota bacterium]